MDTDIDTVILTQPFGYQEDLKEGYNGYAHLLEHMTIKANNEYLNTLEKRGLVFNAETQENQTCYIFLDLTGGIIIKELESGTLKKIYLSTFTEEQLEVERKTIIEEHSLLSNIHGKQNIDKIIGTVVQIQSFDLNTLLRIKAKYYNEATCLLMGNPFHFSGELIFKNCHCNNIDTEWFRHISIEDISYENNFPVLEFMINPYTEFLAYCLKVLFSNSTDVNNLLKVSHEADKLKISFLGNGECLKRIMLTNGEYKKNAYFRYYINLSNGKFLQSELMYLIKYLSPFMSIKQLDFTLLFFNSLWEEALYEKLIVFQN